jgi:hypothetical protein
LTTNGSADAPWRIVGDIVSPASKEEMWETVTALGTGRAACAPSLRIERLSSQAFFRGLEGWPLRRTIYVDEGGAPE